MTRKQHFTLRRLKYQMSDPSRQKRGPGATLAAIRGALLAIFLLGLLGAVAELLLLKHTDGFWKLVPLVLLVAALIVLGWRAIDRGAASVRVFQGTMILFLMSGGAGLLLHYRGNVEFELERRPAARGMALYWQAMKKGATPVLAPGTMIELGLVGLAYAFRHPASVASADDESTTKES